jgi:membrane-associated phospholipid phosphatase
MDALWNAGITWNILLQNLGIWLKTPMEAFSFLGTEYFFLIILSALYWCVEAGIGLRVGIILLLSTSVNDALKLAFHGPRPYWYSSQVIGYAQETSFGAPSGHAQIATGVWGMMAAGLRKWWGWVVAVLVVLLISISRLYLGVHFPHDVILGLLVGALLLWLVLALWKPVARWLVNMSLRRQILLAFLGSLILVVIELITYAWLKATNWQPPQAWASYASGAVTLSGAFTTAGTIFGLLAGLAWFSSQGGFDPTGLLWKRLVRFLLGLVGVLIIYLGLSILFELIVPDSEAVLPYILRYVRYALLGAWMTAGAPWVFVRLHLAEKAA